MSNETVSEVLDAGDAFFQYALQTIDELCPKRGAAVATLDPPMPVSSRQGGIDAVSRAAAYVAKVPGAVSGEGGHNQTFRVACALRKGFGLSFDEALPIITAWNATCEPPWSDRELEHKLRSAESAEGPKGYLLQSAAAAGVYTGSRRGRHVGGELAVSDDSRVAAADRPQIELRMDEAATVDEVLSVIRDDADLYMMRQTLCRIVADEELRLKPLPHDENSLRNLVAGRCDFFVMTAATDKRSGDAELVPKPARIQGWVYKALASRGEWAGVRPLAGVVNRPCLRPDGSVADVCGYDAATRLFLDLRGEWPRVPDAPGLEAARAAAERLLEVVVDFPFGDEASRAAWLCAVLTPLARPAYTGATAPLFAIDANTRGSGKSLLAELVGQIVLGGPVVRIVTARDADEMRKRITAVLLAASGSGVVAFDNVVGALGGEALDALLTADVWTDRALGTSQQVDIPARATWLATGNNLLFRGDMERRVCRIRLESPDENPEERVGFRFPNVVDHVRRHRRELLVDALTILKAFVVAGRPCQNLPAWGSFEGWSNLVRQAVAWVGVGDAGAGRALVREEADESTAGVVAMMDALQAADPENDGLTARAILDAAAAENPPGRLQDAVAAVCELEFAKVTPAKLGNRLRTFRGRNVAGRMLRCKVGSGRERSWHCELVRLTHSTVGDTGDTGDTHSGTPRSEIGNWKSECDLQVAGNSVTSVTSVTPDVIDEVASSFQ